MEEIVLHVLEHYKKVTGEENLCIAGGVAHNCSMNGKILATKFFRNVFVHPAAHDAGGALGAALYVIPNATKVKNCKELKHVYLGTDIPMSDEIEREILKWKNFIKHEKSGCIEKDVASLLSSNCVVGWIQGKSEFGPRALGNRSILADPRIAKNKDLINSMVKKRESYRPFAPSVLEEMVSEYFVLPTEQNKFPFMNFVLEVKPNKRKLLGAITHVDGTARVQTVSKDSNEKYWNLIKCFGELTGVYMILNTSFNNNVEPIVDSVTDAIICFLTTQIHYLVIDDFILSKKSVNYNAYMELTPILVEHCLIHKVRQYTMEKQILNEHYVGVNFDMKTKYLISEELYTFIYKIDGNRKIEAILNDMEVNEQDKKSLIDELIKLWESRVISLIPR